MVVDGEVGDGVFVDVSCSACVQTPNFCKLPPGGPRIHHHSATRIVSLNSIPIPHPRRQTMSANKYANLPDIVCVFIISLYVLLTLL